MTTGRINQIVIRPDVNIGRDRAMYRTAPVAVFTEPAGIGTARVRTGQLINRHLFAKARTEQVPRSNRNFTGFRKAN